MKKFTTALFSILFVLILAPLAHAEAISAARILELVNAERRNAGLNEVSFESRLNQAAQIKVSDMASKSYFDHVSPDGTDPWDLLARVGYDWEWAGENLALNSQTLSEEAIVKAWMNSPGHRAIILTASHTQTGIGITAGTHNGQSVVYVSQFFASPKVEDSVPELSKPEPETTMIYHSESEPNISTNISTSVSADTSTSVVPITSTNTYIETKVVAAKVSKVNPKISTTAAKALAPVNATTSSSVTSSAQISTTNPELANTAETSTQKSFWKVNLSIFMSKLIVFFVQTAQAWNR